MTKKETIYNALGMIEGAVCVSQKNTRDVLMKAIQMIKNAVEEDTEPVKENPETETKCDCDHKWELKESWNYDPYGTFNPYGKYVCVYCGKTETRKL